AGTLRLRSGQALGHRACFESSLERVRRVAQAPAWAVAFSVDSLEGTTTTVNQYSVINRTTRRNWSKSIGLTMYELQRSLYIFKISSSFADVVRTTTGI